MINICKKWISAPKCLRIALVTIYLYTTLAIHLHHTCHQNSKNTHTSVLKCSGCCHLHIDSSANIVEASIINHGNSSSKNRSGSGICVACLYLATAKSSVPSFVSSLLVTQIIIPTQLLPKSSLPKRLEWLSSILLRAPPITIS